SYLEELRSEFPASLLDLGDVRGVGPKKAIKLHAELGIETIDDLSSAIEDGSLQSVSGFGPRTVDQVRKGIETWKTSRSKVLLPMALEIASTLAARIEAIESVSAVEIAGEVRRRSEVVSRLVIVVASENPRQAIDDLAEADLPGRFDFDRSGMVTGTVRPSLETRIVVVEPNRFVPRLFLETGSDEFIDQLNRIGERKKVRIDRDGVRVKGRLRKPGTEEELLSYFDRPLIGPEMRESSDVLTRNIDPSRVVAREDLLGTFHAHTTWSDGKASLPEMIEGAYEIGLEYIGISDHSKSAGYAGGLTEDRVRMQSAELRRAREEVEIEVFHGTECDILVDGSMDYDDEILASFDFVIASVHSRFSMPPDEMSDRIIRAISNPRVTFIGHLTGRKLLIREGYSVEYDRVFDAAAEHGVVIEINGNPRRQDLDWRQMKNALDRGVTFSINPDAHSVAALEHVTTGVWNARRGLVPREAVLNTRPVDEVKEYLEKRKELAG
ncbi:MAG: PHP domain-containing protein, partial [Thermoanaerobaculia bacterium]|nr:PHP domain-containing protein [Thermoanaerobaculia bacterium]